MTDSFQTTKKFREGNLKTSFIYLLIDPRILENLLAELPVGVELICIKNNNNSIDFYCFQFISKNEAWRRFINAIFYVGKGKSSRPYAHLYDAIKLFNG